MGQIIRKMFAVINPIGLPRTVDIRDRFDLCVASQVVVSQVVERKDEQGWINSGLSVSNMARADVQTGVVDKSYNMTNEDVVHYDFPSAPAVDATTAAWLDSVPSVIKPERASQMILRKFKNINTLKFEEGWAALLDASMTINLAGTALIGSDVGRTADKEKPLFFYCPDDLTADGSTGCGKSLLAETVANIVMPGVRIMYTPRMLSAPAIRTMCQPIKRFGGCAFDEFYPPEDPGHPFSLQGLQSMATGGQIAPGEALANADPLSLKYNLHFTTKIIDAPPDIMNRLFTTFMRPLTDETRLDGNDLSRVKSGYASAEIRFSHLLWMHKNQIVDKIRELTLVPGIHRFDGHSTVAAMLTSVEQIIGYYEASSAHAIASRSLAISNGVFHQVTGNEGFSIISWLCDADDAELKSLSALSSIHKGLKIRDLASTLAVVHGHGSLDQAARDLNLSVRAIETKVGAELAKAGKVIIREYTAEAVKVSGKTRVWIKEIGA